jgi:hypothetical protein
VHTKWRIFAKLRFPLPLNLAFALFSTIFKTERLRHHLFSVWMTITVGFGFVAQIGYESRSFPLASSFVQTPTPSPF